MKKLLGCTIVFTFLLIVWGGIVRNSGAGLACPDWPLCQGKMIPPLETLVLLEWGHRLIASFVVIFALAVTLLAIGSSRYRQPVGKMAGIAFFLLIAQALLGALTVKHALGPGFVTFHLAVAWIFLGLLLWMWMKVGYQRTHLSTDKKLTSISFLALALVYGQGVLGAYVSSSHAGLACPDFPTCFGQWIPEMVGGVPYQWMHRLVAFGVLIVIMSLVVVGLRAQKEGLLRVFLWGVLVSVTLQISFGIGNVLLRLPRWMSVAHLGMGTTLFAMLVLITYILTYEKNVSLSSTDEAAD